MTISLSSQAIITEIQALSALRSYMNNGAVPLLNDDRNRQLTILAVDSFYFTIMKIAAYVGGYRVSPENYFDETPPEVMMTLEIPDDRVRDLPPGIVRRQIEHAVACLTLHTVSIDTDRRLADSYRETYDAAIETVRDLLDGTDSPLARILPSR